MDEITRQTITLGDLAVLLWLMAGMSAVLWAAGVTGRRLMDWIDERRAPSPLTPEQLADRGAPTYWADVFPIDAEGEVVR